MPAAKSDDEDHDSLDTPIPAAEVEQARRQRAERRSKPPGGTIDLDPEQQVLVRVVRLEGKVDTIHEMLEALLHRQGRISERCIKAFVDVSTSVAGVVKEPSKGTLVLAFFAVLIVAPGSLLMVANSDAGRAVAAAVAHYLAPGAPLSGPPVPGDGGAAGEPTP